MLELQKFCIDLTAFSSTAIDSFTQIRCAIVAPFSEFLLGKVHFEGPLACCMTTLINFVFTFDLSKAAVENFRVVIAVRFTLVQRNQLDFF